MFKSRYPRLILNEAKWRFDLSKCRVYYIHRGAPGNVRAVDGSAIKSIERGFLVLEGQPHEVYIPYHRIIRIDYNGRVVFERTERAPGKKRIT